MRTNKLPQAINEEQLHQMIKMEINSSLNSPKNKFLHLRNAIMLYFGFMLGLRTGEILGAKMSDLDIDNHTFYIRGQNNKLRQGFKVELPNPLIPKLNAYLGFRNVFYADCEWLFPSIHRKRIDRSVIAKIIKKKAKEMGILQLDYVDKQGINHYNIKPYSLRKGYINHVMRKTGFNLQKTKVMARHRSINTTLKYYLEINEDNLRADTIKEIFE